jgi:PAS domain S-box-containing protein
MEGRIEQPAEEIKRLQRCLNDLVSVLALPAIWVGADPYQIARTLLDVLLGLLSLDLVYVRMKDPAGEAPLEMVRVAPSRTLTAPPQEIGALLGSWLQGDPNRWPRWVRNPVGDGDIAVVVLRLGLQGDIGVLVAGSQRPDFPQQTERLLLSVAVNQAVIGLQEARLLSEQKRVTRELDQRVTQRTAELAAANEELRQSQEDLRTAESKSRLIIDTTSDAVITMDSGGTITTWNKQAEVIFGWSNAEAVGQRMSDMIIPQQHRIAHERGLLHFLATGDGPILRRRIEVTAVRRSGVEFPVELEVSPIAVGAEWVFSAFIRDITDSKRAQEELRNTQADLAHMTRVMTMGELTASIAHEVNQPLAGIITNASTCLRMLAADPPNVDGARETARRTIRDGNRASEVVTRLRSLYSKKDATTELMDLNDATQEVIALSLNELQRNSVVLRSALDDDLPRISGDRVQLQQVILNLLRNASDAMSGVDDRPRQLLITTEREEGERVRLTVQDAGVGFDPQAVQRLFQPFYTTKNDGMGMGLSVSRSIIEGHQGRLWATLNDGPGATFAFSIPHAGERASEGRGFGALQMPAATEQ